MKFQWSLSPRQLLRFLKLEAQVLKDSRPEAENFTGAQGGHRHGSTITKPVEGPRTSRPSLQGHIRHSLSSIHHVSYCKSQWKIPSDITHMHSNLKIGEVG